MDLIKSGADRIDWEGGGKISVDRTNAALNMFTQSQWFLNLLPEQAVAATLRDEVRFEG